MEMITLLRIAQKKAEAFCNHLYLAIGKKQDGASCEDDNILSSPLITDDDIRQHA